MSSLSASARSKALTFVVAGKNLKQLEEWLKLYDQAAAARLKGQTDRYPFMLAVEDRLAQLKKMQQEAGEGEEEEEEEVPSKTTGKRKSRASLGYEAGKPDPASPRVKKVTGKRKSSGTAAAAAHEAESDEESAASEESAPAANVRPTKKIRTAKSMAPQSTTARRASTKATIATASGKKKGRTARAAHHEEEEEEDDGMSEGEEDDESVMADVKATSAKSAKSRASMPSQSTAAAVAAAAARNASPPAPYVDASLFAPSRPAVSPEEDHDVRMRSPTPSPDEGKFEIAVAPAPAVPNPFQVASPGASPATSPAPAAAAAAAARPSLSSRASTVAPSVPIAAPRKSISPTVPVSVGAPAPAPARFNPSLAAPSVPFSVSPSGGGLAGFAGVSRVSPLAPEPSQRFQIADDYALPSHRPPVLSPGVRRASMPSSAYLQQQAADELAESQHEEAQMRRRRHSDVFQRPPQQQPQFESKYSTPSEDDEFDHELTEEEEAAAIRAEKRARFSQQRRRYSDRVTGIIDGVHVGEEEGGGSGIGTGATPQPPAPRPSFLARARSFLRSLGQFLLRTLLIGLMVMTVVLLFSEPAFRHLLLGRPVSTTVFCPSDPNEPPPTEFPPGQLVCAPCPLHGYCTEGKLTCVDSGVFVREGDECVLNTESHKRSAALKELAVGVLERRKGDLICGYIPDRTEATMSELELKTAVEQEVPNDQLFPTLWPAALKWLDKEAAPEADKNITTARVLVVSEGSDIHDAVYEAVDGQLSMGCTLRMLLTRWLWEIVSASLVISIITYLWFLIRRWRWRRAQVGLVADAVRDRLQQMLIINPGTGAYDSHKPMAIMHAREEYMNGQLTGRKGDAVVWERVAAALNKDSRIEKAKHTFGNSERASWTWVAAMPYKQHDQ